MKIIYELDCLLGSVLQSSYRNHWLREFHHERLTFLRILEIVYYKMNYWWAVGEFVGSITICIMH